LAPAKTPKAVVNSLNAAINEILQTPDAKERLNGIGITPTPTSPEKFAEQIKLDLNLFGNIVKTAGIKAE